MILKIKGYLSAYNEYCEVNLEGTCIYIKLIIGNRKSGSGTWFLVSYLSKRLGYLKIVDREQGIWNQELVPCSLFWYVIPMFQKCKSGIRSYFRVPFNYNWVYTCSWFCLSSSCKTLNDTKE